MKLTFLGDIMLGRFVGAKYNDKPYDIVSEDVKKIANESDYIIANLESPITTQESTSSLAFAGDLSLLEQLKWVDMFSLANNHINDFGEDGITETLNALDNNGLKHNGIFKNQYEPFIIDDLSVAGGNKVAIVTCTDMLNVEMSDNSQYKLLRADSDSVNEIIRAYNELGYFTILFSHCGSLFSRYPNPLIRDMLYSAIDVGAKCVVTCHSHCLGGMDIYKGVPIFYSIGDFLMDGGSYRRRQACMLQLDIREGRLEKWTISPTITNKELQTVMPSEHQRRKLIRGFEEVSSRMQRPRKDYSRFYKWQYKSEILSHSLSTLYFLFASKGLWGSLKILKVRFLDVLRMAHRIIFDRSKVRYDADAVNDNLKNSDIQ